MSDADFCARPGCGHKRGQHNETGKGTHCLALVNDATDTCGCPEFMEPGTITGEQASDSGLWGIVSQVVDADGEVDLVLAHAVDDRERIHLRINLTDPDAEFPVHAHAFYPCAKCGWEQSCEDCHA